VEELRAEDHSLRIEMNTIMDEIQANKEPQYESRAIWNRVYRLNDTLDTLLRMLPPSGLPMNS
jgi:hypothetical protein